MTTRYFDPALHGEIESERATRLAVMRGVRKMVAAGIKSDWPPLQVWAKHVWIVDCIYTACIRPE